MNRQILIAVLGWLSVLLILRVLLSILSNYPDYFPPNFDSLFLEGREDTFAGLYRTAFYVHIFTSPIVLLNGLLLFSNYIHRHHRGLHRVLGRIQVFVLLLFVLPSSVVMAQHSYGGWRAGLSFILLALATAICVSIGVVHARGRRFALHRKWMIRTYLLICSAVVLRLLSGTLELFGIERPATAYILAVWCSWLVPLTFFEVMEYVRATQPVKPLRV